MPQINWGDRKSLAYRLAFFGRMIFSCLVDADFRDTEAFYCAVEGRTVDRHWPRLPDIVDALISRFDAHMAEKASGIERFDFALEPAQKAGFVADRVGQSRVVSRDRMRDRLGDDL
jgi:hypothetical protein